MKHVALEHHRPAPRYPWLLPVLLAIAMPFLGMLCMQALDWELQHGEAYRLEMDRRGMP